MPVLPNRALKKYSSLPTDSPSSDLDPSPRPKLCQSVSAPPHGNKLVNAFLHFRTKWSEDHKNSDLADPMDSPDKVDLTSTPIRRGEESDRPHLSPYFQHRKRNDLSSSTEEEKRKLDTDKEERAKLQGGKRPTLNPFFNANHHFMKALRRMGSKDNFTRLKPGRDD